MPRYALVSFAVLTLVACSYSQRKVKNLAADRLSCADVEVKPLGDDNYEASGCGRAVRYYCEPIYGKGPNEHVAVDYACAPLSVALPALERARQHEDACDSRCSAALRSCADGCTSAECMRGCTALGSGCLKGCIEAR
jgi:hypothetical protein